jgi:glycosyltransferase involved in cell wall biosynthesis
MRSHPCPVCSSVERHYLFHSVGTPVVECFGCGLVYRDLSRKSKRGTQAEAQGHFDMLYRATPPEDDITESDFAQRCISHLVARGLNCGRVLISSPVPVSSLISALQQAGYDCKHTGDVRQEPISSDAYDAILFPYSLERYDNPAAVLETAQVQLQANGLLVVCTQSIDSKWARFLGQQWTGWRPEILFYFNRRTLQLLLEKRGFEQLVAAKDERLYSLEHILSRARVYPRSFITGIAAMSGVLPKSLRQSVTARVRSSGMIVSSRKAAPRQGTKLSIIMPVYNEKNSFADTLQKVLAKEVPGISEREIVIVESNSKDGTRELVQTFESHPGVKVVYEERPRGKGHAVRVGFKEASGDIVLIQDADSEYDVDDYDELLEPLIEYRELFVLGTRHNGSWKMREFTDSPQLAAVMNLGQIFFTTLMNVLYQQNMSDPFTMYKVLRRECLYGIHFECNRFDFDHELVIKLLLKGYKPLEIPVNYRSRSYSEGKKVTFVQDPLLWIRANFKFRVVSPYTFEFQQMIGAATGKLKLRPMVSKVNSSISNAAKTAAQLTGANAIGTTDQPVHAKPVAAAGTGSPRTHQDQ